MSDARVLALNMVERQLRDRGIEDPRVLAVQQRSLADRFAHQPLADDLDDNQAEQR